MERGHRRVFYATEGSATLPGRFAIDFMKLDERGKFSSGDADIPASHHGFGAEVLTVADGTIVAVRDAVPDPAAVKGRTSAGIGGASGNYGLQIGSASGRDRGVQYM